MKKIKYIIPALLIFQAGWSQKKDENIGTEVVNVVKPYSPTISDAFKVKEIPTLDDEVTTKKEKIDYNIFSFPVASTFVPSKGKAANVEKSPEEKYFSNYALLGFGNYGTLNAELFVTHEVNDTDYLGAMFRHISSQGGIDNVVLDDSFYNTGLDLTYGSRGKNASWATDAGYKKQTYNWYGIHPEIADNVALADVEEKQSYNTLYAGGKVSMSEGVFSGGSLEYTHFWDAFGSSENRFFAKPSIAFDINNKKFKSNFILDYVSTSFEQVYHGGEAHKYGYTNFGFEPSMKIQKDDFDLNLGVGLYYSAAQEGGENKFYFYPQFTGSYKLVGDLMVLYGGLEGTLQQNSYHDFVQGNFFVSPTLAIRPTSQEYDGYVGLKGKLANTVSFNVKGSYKKEEGKAFYESNGYDFNNANQKGYTFANSFNVVYDDVKTASFYGELKADFSKSVSFGVNGMFNSYSMDKLKEAWNLPSMKITSTLDVVITEKWSAGASLFFMGERKDQFIVKYIEDIPANQPYPPQDVTLPSYVDLNANVSYKFNERWNFFLKGNNLLNKNYERWLNYPVQGIQVLGGATYKFDF